VAADRRPNGSTGLKRTLTPNSLPRESTDAPPPRNLRGDECAARNGVGFGAWRAFRNLPGFSSFPPCAHKFPGRAGVVAGFIPVYTHHNLVSRSGASFASKVGVKGDARLVRSTIWTGLISKHKAARVSKITPVVDAPAARRP